MELPEGTRFQVLAPIVRGRKGEYEKLLGDLARKGFPRARIDGEVRELSEPIRLPKTYKHTIEVVVDRLVAKPDIRRRVADSIETALELAEGIAAIAVQTHDGDERDPELLAGARVHVLRVVVRRARAAELLVQLAVRARARRATGSAPASRSTPSSSSPTPTCRSTRARSRRGPATRSSTGTACSRPSPRRTASRSTPRGRSSRKGRATSSSTARTRRSSSGTRTGTAASARTTPPTRACSRTSNGGTPRPTPTRRARSSSSSCARSRAGPARAPACGRSRLAVTVGGLNISQLTEQGRSATPWRSSTTIELSEREHMIAERLLKEIRERLGLPGGRRPRLPVARPRGGDARRGRGAAHPAGDPDRQRPGRRAVHPRRAVDRPAPARQPAADRHARAPARPRQHADRRRARRGDDHGGRPHRRHRAARRGARRRDRLLGRPEGPARRGAIDHRRVPVGAPADPDAAGPPQAERAPAPAGGRPRAQPAERHRRHPARAVRLRHGRIREREVDAGPGRAAARADAEDLTARACSPASTSA